MKGEEKKMKKIRLLVVVGRKEVGKDTLANVFLDSYSKFKKYAFADELKKIALKIGWDGKKDIRGRSFLKKIGQLGKENNVNIWVNYVIDNIRQTIIDNYNSKNEYESLNFVITDCRYLNEMEEIKRFIDSTNAFFNDNIMVMKSVKIVRPLQTLSKEDPDEDEVDKIETDYQIENTGTIKDYISKCNDFYKTMKTILKN
jgi:hypothetical protein